MLAVIGIEKPVNVESCLEGRLGVVLLLYFCHVGVEIFPLGHGEEGSLVKVSFLEYYPACSIFTL